MSSANCLSSEIIHYSTYCFSFDVDETGSYNHTRLLTYNQELFFFFFTLFLYGTRYREKNTNFCKFLAQKFNKLADDTFLLGSENQGNMLSDGMETFRDF